LIGIKLLLQTTIAAQFSTDFNIHASKSTVTGKKYCDKFSSIHSNYLLTNAALISAIALPVVAESAALFWKVFCLFDLSKVWIV